MGGVDGLHQRRAEDPRVTKHAEDHLLRKEFVFTDAVPRETARVDIKRSDADKYYNDITPQLNGVHPGLVFNVDEMGVELFSDRNEVKAFVRPTKSPTTDFCRLASRDRQGDAPSSPASLNGDTMVPTIITRTKRSIHASLTVGSPWTTSDRPAQRTVSSPETSFQDGRMKYSSKEWMRRGNPSTRCWETSTTRSSS